MSTTDVAVMGACIAFVGLATAYACISLISRARDEIRDLRARVDRLEHAQQPPRKPSIKRLRDYIHDRSIT